MKTQTKQNRTMLTDLYQLTMNAAYFDQGKNDEATFDLFIRKLPENWGYFVANGIEDAIDYATNIKFEEDDIEYLRGQGLFKEEFLEKLRDFRFTGDIYAVKEGTPIGANTPLISVRGPRMEAQLLETVLLNTVNFQTMVASKASRVVQSAGPASVHDFGLRRAQEMDAAMLGARATYIGGAVGTSNVLAGKEFGIPISGTQAHSYVMSFDSEIQAFRAYVQTFPKNAILLIDTYDTVQGARNAAIVGKEMEKRGEKLRAVRLDSGDLETLSKEVRKVLDEAGLNYVRIVASNDLNEYKIDDLRDQDARIDGFGVGTEMITAKPTAAISGVYKLVEDESGGKIKLSSGKKSFPGRKQVYRFEDSDGRYSHDILALEDEEVLGGRALLEMVVSGGERVKARRSLEEIRSYSLGEVAKMSENSLGVYATPYEMRESEGLKDLSVRLRESHMAAEVMR